MKFFQKHKKIILTLTIVYIVSAGVSYGIFRLLGGGGPKTINTAELSSVREKIASEPKTEECPINGMMYTATEKDIWEGRRPMGVMIENHPDSRPLSGLSRADVVYEAVAEGGTTRYMGVYYCDAARQSTNLAVIRSSRVYFIDWISEYGKNPIYVHWGGANNTCQPFVGDERNLDCNEDGTKLAGKVDPRVMAIEKLFDIGWRSFGGNALDGGWNAGETIFRNYDRLDTPATAAEHTPEAMSDDLYALAAKNGFDGRGWQTGYEPWLFADANPSSNPDASTIEFEFWPNKPDFEVVWEYQPETNTYLRSNGGEKQIDWEFDRPQIETTNIAIQFVEEETGIDDEHHVYYYTVGSGDALIFQNGTVIEATWKKDSRTERTRYYDNSGKEISFVRGKIWVEAVPAYGEVVYE